jgi:hypothetical protein
MNCQRYPCGRIIPGAVARVRECITSREVVIFGGRISKKEGAMKELKYLTIWKDGRWVFLKRDDFEHRGIIRRVIRRLKRLIKRLIRRR